MIKPLTSLRFFFAFMVFLSHIGFVNVDSPLYNWLHRNVFREGLLGVSFFFILSGFILSYTYEQKVPLKRNKLYNFYLSRFARIYPLHLITIFFALPILISQNLLNLKALFFNLFLIQSFVPIPKIYYSINPPSWSISNEMFFYLLFPIYIYLFNRYKNLHVYFFFFFYILIIILHQIIPVQYKEFFLYVNPLIRTLDFILGISLLKFYTQNKNMFLNKKNSFIIYTFLEFAVCFMFLLFFILHNIADYTYRFSIYYWIPMSAIIYIFAFQGGAISKFLSHKWLIFLGEISFGFYMIHFVVLYYALWLKPIFFSGLNDIIYAFFIFTFTLIFSFISYKWYELPVNRYFKAKFLKK